MILNDAVRNLSALDEEGTLYVKKPWTSDSECILLGTNQDSESTKQSGFSYFLEIHVANEVIQVFKVRKPSLEEILRLLIFYAENDAYPEWVNGD